MLKDMFFSALVVIVVVAIAAIVGPKGPSAPPDPTLSGANPRPDWPFLWLFGLLSLSPPAAETVIMLVLPVILVVGLLAVPFISNRGERRPQPPAGCGVVGGAIYAVLGVLTHLGHTVALVAGDDGLEWRSGTASIIKSTPPTRRWNCKGPSCFRTSSAAIVTRWTDSAESAAPTSRLSECV